MTLSIDFDRTWTQDPNGWASVARFFRDRGHTVLLVTNRSRLRHHHVFEVQQHCRDHVDAIIFAGEQPKRVAARQAGYHVDVWVDDTPESIHFPSPR